MKQDNSELWMRERKARDSLAEQLLGHPDISLIDIGYEQDSGTDKTSKHMVIRVHLRKPPAQVPVEIPDEIDGIPVQVILADYRLE